VRRLRLVVLAAGRGERLKPITETRPKPLVKILDEPIICRNLEMVLSRRSFDDIVIVSSKDAKERIENVYCVKKLKESGKARVIIQDPPQGTAHAVLKALDDKNDILVVYSDVFIPRSSWDFISKLKPSSILAAPAERPWEYGVLKVDPPYVKDIIEKPEPREAPQGSLVFIGVAAIASDHFKYLKELRRSPRGEYELTDALLQIANNEELKYVALNTSEWRDVGRPWDLLLANRYALKNEVKEWKKKGEVHPTAIIDDNVYIEEGTSVGPYSVIEGPSYISSGVSIGPHTHIRPYSIILEGARVGYSVEVKASIIMEGAKASHFNYIGDSIICEDVNLGAGTITANLRFDRRTVKMTVKGKRVDTGLKKLGAVVGGHAQTGINVSLMPGVKVGSYAKIWPGCVVYRDVPAGAEYRC
jgi:UDP-N-acetylglucosamine diphosphorylase/glucosamine-1-phosphate N-acetyltransferase